MKIKFIIMLVLVFFWAGCVTQGKIKENNKNVRTYSADLDGDGSNEIVETEDKTDTDSICLVTAKKNDKTGEVLGSFSIAGKIRDIAFAKLTPIEQEAMVVYFDGEDGLSNIVIYQLKNKKLSKIFAAASAYGVEANLDSPVRIKIGQAPENANSPNLIPDWNTWVWSGDKFVNEQ